MTDRDSDSDLEFESADENQDLSDLDVDEILNEDKIEDKDPIEEKNYKIDSNQSKENEDEIQQTTHTEEPVDNQEETSLKSESEPINSSTKENSVEEKKVLEDIKELKIDEVKDDKQIKNTDLSQNEQREQVGWDEAEFEGLDNDLNDSVHDDKNSTKADNIQSQEIERENLFKDTMKKETNKEMEPNEEKNNPPKEVSTSSKERGWGWSSFLSTAVNITSKVGEGFNTVLNTVEAGIGAPDPTELAAKVIKAKNENQEKEEIEKTEEKKQAHDWSFDESGNDSEWFSLPKIQNITPAGLQIVSSGLNVLEAVGKKTIGLISEKDPNFEQTRTLLDKVPANISSIKKQPTLSEILREAKANEANEIPVPSKTTQITKIKNFDSFFEEFNGKLHMEALEILSREIEVKVEMSLLEKKLNNTKRENSKELDEIFDCKNLDDDSDSDYLEVLDEKILHSNPICNQHDKSLNLKNLNLVINSYTQDLNLIISFDKIQQELSSFLINIENSLEYRELKKQSIEFFASFAAKLIELFHRTVQSILRESKFVKENEVLDTARNFLKIIRLYVKSVTVLADYLCKKCKDLNESSQSKELNQEITDIYLEASNCNTLIGDGFALLLPIFKNQLLSL